jgi:two-component system sensor histidine kinase/response regulator
MAKILVVEDEESIRISVADLLEIQGHQIIEAENGLLGVQLASEQLPDLVVCDIMMPLMDGYDVLHLLRRTPTTAGIPFIFLTAKADRGDRRLGMDLGADDYLTKPFTPGELIGAVQGRLDRVAEIRQRQTEQLDDLRVTITSRLRHELLTPLTVILNASEILTRYSRQLDALEISETSARVHKHGQYLFRLIQKLLLYTQVEALVKDPAQVKAARTSQTLQAQQLVTTVAQQLAQQERRADDLRLQVQEIPTLRIAESHLRQIVWELLENAFKYSSPGSVVLVQGVVKTGGYTLSITDQGRGMPPNSASQIAAYRQFDRDRYEQQGVGLGLVLVKTLTQIYGGDLSIESLSHGTTVHVRLPH